MEFNRLIAVLIVSFCTFSALGQACQLTVRVVAPASTPPGANLLLVGNQAAWGDWFFPDAPKMQKVNDSVWTYHGSFSKSTLLSFKVLRSSYYAEALYGGSTDFPPNLAFRIRTDTVAAAFVCHVAE
jgi:Starch binding domain